MPRTIIACNDERQARWTFNPGAEMRLEAGAVLLFIGRQEQHERLRRLFD